MGCRIPFCFMQAARSVSASSLKLRRGCLGLAEIFSMGSEVISVDVFAGGAETFARASSEINAPSPLPKAGLMLLWPPEENLLRAVPHPEVNRPLPEGEGPAKQRVRQSRVSLKILSLIFHRLP